MAPFAPDLDRPLPHEPVWPGDPGRPVVLLVDASTGLERELVERWIERRRPPATVVDVMDIPPSRRPRPDAHPDPHLQARLLLDDDPLVVPVRVVWLAPEHDGRRHVGLTDLLKFGDPRDPDPLRARWILASRPDRVRILVGEPAAASELREAWKASVEAMTLDEFVARRAWLALERSERALRGNRYKIPRFVKEEILRQREFHLGLAELARRIGRPLNELLDEARGYLTEIAATHSPLVIDLVANAIHWLYRQGYRDIRYDRSELHELYGLSRDATLVFLPSHKSNLDHLVLQYLLWENDLPPNHTAGGINMNFFPVGPLIRRTGVFFIRRSFKDNEVYKFSLRSYIDYLVSRRFPLEWYLEGGRSRIGKLMAPRFGMLSYVTDAYRRGKSDEVVLMPVSLAYDLIQDVGSYAAEQRGAPKQKESFRWLLQQIKLLRRDHGDIHLRFGEPLPLSKEIEQGAPDELRPLAVQKLAFEVCVRINRVTPATAPAIVCTTLLMGDDRAVTATELLEAVRPLLAFIERRGLPTTETLRLGSEEDVVSVLRLLAEHRIVERHDAESTAPLWRLPRSQQIVAAYYRNTIVHFFVPGAIAELALAGVGAERDVARFWEEVEELRDLLKFEFFFPPRERFRHEIDEELAMAADDWESVLATEGPTALLRRMDLLRAHWSLLPFLEAYLLVVDTLAERPTGPEVDEKGFLRLCLDRGKAALLQRRIRAEDAVSLVLFRNALALARHRGLIGADPEAERRRDELSRHLRDLLGRTERVEAIARSRAVGVI